MYIVNPPPVPEGVEFRSTDPGIMAVEHACTLAGLNYEVLNPAKIVKDPDGAITAVHIDLPGLGVHLPVSTITNDAMRQRDMQGQLVFDGQEGIDRLVGMLASLRKS